MSERRCDALPLDSRTVEAPIEEAHSSPASLLFLPPTAMTLDQSRRSSSRLDTAEAPAGAQSFYGHLGYDVDRLLALMEKRGLDQAELTSLEWLWLGAIENSERGPRSLQRQMLSDPALFIQLMKAMFKRDFGERDPSEETVPGVGMQGYRFLRTIRELPACKCAASAEPTRLARDGDIVLRTGEADAAALRAWVTAARDFGPKLIKIAIGRIETMSRGSKWLTASGSATGLASVSSRPGCAYRRSDAAA